MAARCRRRQQIGDIDVRKKVAEIFLSVDDVQQELLRGLGPGGGYLLLLGSVLERAGQSRG